MEKREREGDRREGEKERSITVSENKLYIILMMMYYCIIYCVLLYIHW
jgi:hypothetical protein